MNVSDCPHCGKPRKIEKGRGILGSGCGHEWNYISCTNKKCNAPKLRECPFCLGEAYVGQNIDIYGSDSYYIFCSNCNARSDVLINSKDAEEAWNRRNDLWEWEKEVDGE